MGIGGSKPVWSWRVGAMVTLSRATKMLPFNVRTSPFEYYSHSRFSPLLAALRCMYSGTQQTWQMGDGNKRRCVGSYRLNATVPRASSSPFGNFQGDPQPLPQIFSMSFRAQVKSVHFTGRDISRLATTKASTTTYLSRLD